MLRMRRAFALVLLAGCAGTPVVPDAPEPLDHYLCRYFLNPYYLGEGELRLAPGEPAFAKVSAAGAAGTELVLPFGEASQGAQAAFTSGWVTFHARYFGKKGVEVHVKKPLAFSPVLTWLPGEDVRWLGSDDDGRMRVDAQPPERFAPAQPLRAAVACEDTTLGTPREASGSSDDKREEVELWGEGPVPVRSAPGGAIEGQLTLDKEWNRADRIAEQGEWVRIRLELYPGRLEGWVPKGRTRAAPKDDAVGGLGLLGGLMGGEGRGTPHYPRCAGEATLYLARTGEPLRKVGEVHKHAAVLPGESRAGWVEVRLPEDDWVKLEPGAAWAMPAEELARCQLTQHE